MITNNYINKNNLPSDAWGYDSFGYGFDISFWSRLEVYYTCIIFDGKRKPNPSNRDLIMFNQDRHLGIKFLLFRSGDFGLNWAPNIVFGINDFDSGLFSARPAGNGFFTRVYAVASKSFSTKGGSAGLHLGYQFNNWTYYSLYGVCAAVDWRPIWLQNEKWITTKLIAEYDAKSFNIGFIASIWREHFDFMVDLQAMKWLSAGIRFKYIIQK